MLSVGTLALPRNKDNDILSSPLSVHILSLKPHLATSEESIHDLLEPVQIMAKRMESYEQSIPSQQRITAGAESYADGVLHSIISRGLSADGRVQSCSLPAMEKLSKERMELCLPSDL